MSDITYAGRMSDAEGLMWRLKTDPRLVSTFSNVSILDRPPDFDRLRRRMEVAAVRFPRLRQVVHAQAGAAGPPRWVDDPDFAVDEHLRRIALPPPGTDRQLLDLATLIAADPIDRARPLWQFVIVEGLAGHRAALIEKLHHTISDGEAGIQLALEFLDLERDPPDPPIPEQPGTGSVGDDGGFDEDPTAAAVRDVLAGTLRIPLGIARQVRELLDEPDRIPDASAAASEAVHELAEQLRQTGPALSPLWTQRSTRRHLEVAHAPLDETRGAAARLGGTLNTAFLTIAAEAAGRYHAERGAPVESLRASMAISTRTEGSGANAFSLIRMLVPTGDIPMTDRFPAIQEAARTAQQSSPRLDTMAALASTVPTALLTRLARRQATTVDFATSNVRGSPVPLYVAGAKVLHNHPIGPLVGVPFNLTLLSYVDRLDIGIHSDVAAVRQPERLKQHLDDAIGRFASS